MYGILVLLGMFFYLLHVIAMNNLRAELEDAWEREDNLARKLNQCEKYHQKT